MRVVTRKQLMALPAGTVYLSYQPHVFNGLFVKGDTYAPSPGFSGDWLMCGLLDDFGGDSTTVCDEVERLERGDDVPLTFADCYGRDACFDDSQQFAVWSKADVQGLAKFLADAAEKMP